MRRQQLAENTENFYYFRLCDYKSKANKYYIQLEVSGEVSLFFNDKLITSIDYKQKFGDNAFSSTCLKVWYYVYKECRKYTDEPIYIDQQTSAAYRAMLSNPLL